MKIQLKFAFENSNLYTDYYDVIEEGTVYKVYYKENKITQFFKSDNFLEKILGSLLLLYSNPHYYVSVFEENSKFPVIINMNNVLYTEIIECKEYSNNDDIPF